MLNPAQVGAKNTVERITWVQVAPDGTRIPQDLTGATLTGRKQSTMDGETVAIDGTLTPVSPLTSGLFDWKRGTVDVSAGNVYEVQFKAAYTDYDLSMADLWVVEPAL